MNPTNQPKKIYPQILNKPTKKETEPNTITPQELINTLEKLYPTGLSKDQLNKTTKNSTKTDCKTLDEECINEIEKKTNKSIAPETAPIVKAWVLGQNNLYKKYSTQQTKQKPNKQLSQT